jgi:hypothetical protein
LKALQTFFFTGEPLRDTSELSDLCIDCPGPAVQSVLLCFQVSDGTNRQGPTIPSPCACGTRRSTILRSQNLLSKHLLVLNPLLLLLSEIVLNLTDVLFLLLHECMHLFDDFLFGCDVGFKCTTKPLFLLQSVPLIKCLQLRVCRIIFAWYSARFFVRYCTR